MNVILRGFFERTMENYVLYDELGRGSYSVVYKGRKKGSVEYVAVHCSEKTKRKELQNIVRLTHELSHDNIVTFYEWYETTNHIWMIMELCTGQSLSTMLEQDGCFPETTVRSFGLDIASGLHYLHGLGILYCDLRCSKLILDGYGKVKLSNFSLAKVEDEPDLNKFGDDINGSDEESRRPSPMYMAPEVLQSHPYSVSSDLWSFGCVLYELFTGCVPFQAESFPELVDKVMTQNILYPLQVINGIETGPSDEFYSLVQSLMGKDEGQRISWNELLRHPFWDGNLRLSMDDVDETLAQEEDVKREQHVEPVLEQGKPISAQQDEKEAGILASDEGRFLKKPNIRQTVARGSEKGHVTHVSKQRPGTAPEGTNSSIRNGTYKVEHLRPHTTQSDLAKTRKLTKEEREGRSNVSQSLKSNTPKKKGPGSKSVRADKSGGKYQNFSEKTSNHVSPRLHSAGLDVEKLLYHPSDFVVTSIVDNPKIKKVVIPKWDAKTIGITTLTVDQLLKASDDEQTKYLKEVSVLLEQSQRTSSQSGGQRSKLHCASYLVSILQDTDVANLVANSSLVFGLLQVIKQSSSADLKARLGNCSFNKHQCAPIHPEISGLFTN